MIDQQRPIAPTYELVQHWLGEHYGVRTAPGEATMHVAAQAVQWGDDQRLKAVCEWLNFNYPSVNLGALRADMRPDPPSEIDQALALLDARWAGSTADGSRIFNWEEMAIMRRALERLRKLEEQIND